MIIIGTIIFVVIVFSTIIILGNNKKKKIKNKSEAIRIELLDILAYWRSDDASIWQERCIYVLKNLNDNTILLCDIANCFCNVHSIIYRSNVVGSKIKPTGEFRLFVAPKKGIINKEVVLNRPMHFNEKGYLWIDKSEKKRRLNLNNVYQIEDGKTFPFSYKKTYYKVNKEIDKSILEDAKFVRGVIEFDIEKTYQ